MKMTTPTHLVLPKQKQKTNKKDQLGSKKHVGWGGDRQGNSTAGIKCIRCTITVQIPNTKGMHENPQCGLWLTIIVTQFWTLTSVSECQKHLHCIVPRYPDSSPLHFPRIPVKLNIHDPTLHLCVCMYNILFKRNAPHSHL